MHRAVCTLLPRQLFSPYLGGGSSHSLDLVRRPGPQATLQEDQEVQRPQWPGTGAEQKIIKKDIPKGAFVWEYSGIRIYSGIYSGYSAPGSRIAGMKIQVFRNRKSSQTNANLHYSNCSYSGLIPNERALSLTRNNMTKSSI